MGVERIQNPLMKSRLKYNHNPSICDWKSGKQTVLAATRLHSNGIRESVGSLRNVYSLIARQNMADASWSEMRCARVLVEGSKG